MIQCCEDEDNCRLAPAAEGCPAPMPERTPTTEPDSRLSTELAAPLEWFASAEGRPPYSTPRAWLGHALAAPDGEVFVGTIEGEEPFAGDGEPGERAIWTWCSIRVNYVFKGSLVPGAVVSVLYSGGSLTQTESQWHSHQPRCYPFDYGIFTTFGSDPRVPSYSHTFSMLGSGVEWDEHPFTQLLVDLQDGAQ